MKLQDEAAHGCPKAVVVLYSGCIVGPHSLGNPEPGPWPWPVEAACTGMGRALVTVHVPRGFSRATQLPQRAKARRNVHFRSACDCVLEWPLGWCVESLMRLCLLCLSLVCCPWRKCPVTVATKEERAGWNPITFLVETNIWTAPHSSSFSPSHYRYSCTAIVLYFEKPLEHSFFQCDLFKERDVMGSFSL